MVGTKAKYWVLLALMTLTMTACAYGRHMDRGNQAYEAGDYAAAANAYEAALAEDPDSAEAANSLQRARAQMASEMTDEADAALAQEDWIGAVAAASRAHRQLPENRDVLDSVDKVARQVSAKALKLEEAGDFANALLLMQAIADTLPPATQEYGPKADALRGRWLELLAERGAAAREDGKYGTALLYYSKAARLSPSPKLGGQRDTIRRELLDAWSYKVAVKPKGKRAETAAGMLLERVEGTALRIGSTGKWKADELDAVLKVEVEQPKTRTERSSRTESVRYQSGTRQVENPFYESRQRDLERAQQELMRTENDVTRLENDVVRYQEAVSREGPSPNTSTGAEQNLSRARSSLERERDNLIRDRRAVQRARERLADEPQTKEEPVYSDLDYLVETHTMVSTAAVSIDVDHSDARKQLSRRVVVSAESRDETHGAYPQADISADALSLPSARSLEAQLLPRAATVAGTAIEASFLSWREAFLEKALNEPDDAKRTDLLAIYIVTDPSNVDPRVPIELKSSTGIPDVVASLKPSR